MGPSEKFHKEKQTRCDCVDAYSCSISFHWTHLHDLSHEFRQGAFSDFDVREAILVDARTPKKTSLGKTDPFIYEPPIHQVTLTQLHALNNLFLFIDAHAHDRRH